MPSVSPPATDPADCDHACGEAMNLQLAGRTDLAEQMYAAILQSAPEHAAANHCLGMLHVQLRRSAQALPYLSTALNLQPEIPDYWLGYLEALLLAGKAEEAAEVLAIGREHGLTGKATEDFAHRLDPLLRAAPSCSAPALEAPVRALSPARPRPARRANPRHQRRRFDALNALIAQQRHADALVMARSFTADYPANGWGWKTLGALLWWSGNHEEALAPMQNAALLMPADAETHSNLGMALVHAKRVDDAVKSLKRAIQIDGRFAAAHYHLGMVRFRQERYAEAQASLRTAVTQRPDYLTAEVEPCHSILLFLYSHDASMSAEALFAEHCRFGSLIQDQVRAAHLPHPNLRDPKRRLRIGFVSGDMNDHAVATFLEPVLERLCQYPGLELHAYYNETVEDEVTARLRARFKSWNLVAPLSDPALADLIMSQRIDILIDLSGPTGLNRLRAFARKPAPIQVSWLGYPGTTGLRAMDYFLCDGHWLPRGQFDRHFVENLVYLPAAAVFQPAPAAPPINALPALATGNLTFGSFNRLGKITAATVSLWSRLLRALPTSRIILAGIPSGQHARLIERFAAEGVAKERLAVHPRGPMETYLALHHEVDVCLDTVPYNGGTTTHHALWMGVPTLTMAGTTPAGRQGANILGLAGLDEFIAADAADFVAKGSEWAARLARLAELRAGMRERRRQCLSQQPDVLAAAFERALRSMWARWCANLPAESFEIPAAADDPAPLPATGSRPQDAALLALVELRRFDEARVLAAAMTEEFPEHGLGWKILGAMLWLAGESEDALTAMRTSARLMPGDAETHSNLGMILAKMKRFEEGDAYLLKAIEIDPTFAAARYRQGMSYELQGRYTEAEASLRSGIALRSNTLTTDDEQGFSNLLYVLSYSPQVDADALYREHRRVGEEFEARFRAHWPRHRNVADPRRRLQIGLVSGDLRNHAVASFLEPLLAHLCHDASLDLHAYSNCSLEDDVTARLQGYVNHWHRVANIPDSILAQRVIDDRIDVLIDLSGHTGLNRLCTFARKPAPIQASWIGYPGTTGLTAMDYFLADPHFLPPGQFDQYFIEKLVYLPAQAPFQPSPLAPPVNPLPALATGAVTFGSFNRSSKINTATIRVWSELLLALPAAKMLLGGISLDAERDKLIHEFAAHGIERDRLTFHPRCGMDLYLALHHRVDICLDTHPYTGGTTSIHAVWMGVPTLTIAGPTPAGRGGAAILGQVGLDGFTATDAADFVAKGRYWAGHLGALAEVRAGLRARLQHSPSRQADTVAASLGQALRHMWRRWCAGLPAESFHSAVAPAAATPSPPAIAPSPVAMKPAARNSSESR
ncbi:MAG TPA: tetratricopeptide repeat protein [Steroidobacteraceae bacterium]|nr:tetratricopeptide repeat protein [Steroidobacteraceae bacterium]